MFWTLIQRDSLFLPTPLSNYNYSKKKKKTLSGTIEGHCTLARLLVLQMKIYLIPMSYSQFGQYKLVFRVAQQLCSMFVMLCVTFLSGTIKICSLCECSWGEDSCRCLPGCDAV